MMKTSESLSSLATALSLAQGEFKSPPKSKTASIPLKSGGKYEYSYADLADVIDTVRPVMAKNGLSVTQVPFVSELGFFLVTRLLHKSGEWIEGTMRLPDNRSPQELGSCLTYFRRYALCAILGIVADEDDDGSAASKEVPTSIQRPHNKPPTVKPIERASEKIATKHSADIW